MTNYNANVTNSIAKLTNSTAKPTNSIANGTNSIANGMNSIVKATNSIAKTCKGEEITQFHQRNQMISENAWNALMRIGGSIYKLYHS